MAAVRAAAGACLRPPNVGGADCPSGFRSLHLLRERAGASLRVASRSQGSSRAVAVAALSLEKGEDSGVVLVEHYKRLGVSPDATNAEIVKAFEARCLELTEAGSSAGAVDEEAARQRLQELEASLEVLTSEEARRLYDWGVKRAQRGDTDDYVWPFETDLTQKTYTPGIGNPPRPMTPVDDEGIATLGYFFLAWFAVSVVLSLTLN